jgi:hypothetical protein
MGERRLVRLASCVPEGASLAMLRTPNEWPRPIDWLMRDEETGETLRFTEQADGFTFTLAPSLTVLDAAKAMTLSESTDG